MSMDQKYLKINKSKVSDNDMGKTFAMDVNESFGAHNKSHL